MCENPLITAQLVSFLYLENRLSRVKTLIFLIKFLATSFKCFNGFWWFQRFLNLTRIFLKPFEVFSRNFFLLALVNFSTLKITKPGFCMAIWIFQKSSFLNIACISIVYLISSNSEWLPVTIVQLEKSPPLIIYIYLF